MKVKELIKQLKKLNQEATVVSQDHDHSEDEMNGMIDWVDDSDSEVLQDIFGGPVVTIK